MSIGKIKLNGLEETYTSPTFPHILHLASRDREGFEINPHFKKFQKKIAGLRIRHL
jgi:hypothetical protein